tara:strand:+ start:732 stop:914 length:183 start_codon:yes stop_codon:yes gene_type:complete
MSVNYNKVFIPNRLEFGCNIFLIFQMTPEAEKFNGWLAMLGVVAGLGAYATTGQLIPGIF